MGEGALRLLVSMAEGSVRDGLSLLDQVIAGSDGSIDEQAVVDAFGLVRSELFLELNDAVIARDPARAPAPGREPGRRRRRASTPSPAAWSPTSATCCCCASTRSWRRWWTCRRTCWGVCRPQAGAFAEQDLLALIDRAGLHFERIHRSTQPRILLEASVVEYCRFESRVLLSELARRLEALAGGRGPAAGGGNADQVRAGGGAAPRREPGGASARPAASAEAASYAPPPPVVQGAPAIAVGGEVPGWTALINELMKTMPRVGACLMNGLPALDEAAGRLTVTFAEDKGFQVGSIRDDGPAIERLAGTLWGRPLKLDLVLGRRGQEQQKREEIRREVAPTQREELSKACAGDPDLGGLVDLLGGEPLPETDRENWDRPGS